MYKKLKYIILPVLFLLPFASCVTVSEVGTEGWRDYFKPGCSKEEIARDFNLYGGRWWNYYARGRWYAEGGHYDEAIQDFKRSINLRSKDDRCARSYGLHCCEYFAHRELGVVYYEQGKHEDAIKELKTSLATADSAKCKFYLNKCNEAIQKTTKSEQKPPQIRITSHTNGEVVNTSIAKIKGVAVGDGCVNSVAIQGKRLLVELAEKTYTFSQDVPLQVGENIISLEAVDLLGNSAHQSLKLVLDMNPPTLYLNDIQMFRKDGKNIAAIKGTVVDDYGVRSLCINDTTIPVSLERKFDFEQDIVLKDGGKISFRVIDLAGNEIQGEQQIETKASLWPEDILNNYYFKNMPIMVAASKLDRFAADVLLAQESQTLNPPPVFPLPKRDKEGSEKTEDRVLPQEMAMDIIPPLIHTNVKSAVVYDANFLFSGDVHDNSGVAKVFINEHPLEIGTGKHIFFNHILKLHEGENTIVVRAVDIHGNEYQHPLLKITKKTFELLETDARYSVVLLPLKIKAGQEIPSETLYCMLLKAFDEDTKRFKFVETDHVKVMEMLNEQKKMSIAEGVLLCDVEEEAKGINIMLRLVDTETNDILVDTEVYDDDKSIKNLKLLMYYLSLKMKQQFPVIQGNIIQVSGNGFYINAGATSGMRVGMKLLPYREIKEGDYVLKVPLDTVARVVQVQPETSFAKITSPKDNKKIEKQDIVITK